MKKLHFIKNVIFSAGLFIIISLFFACELFTGTTSLSYGGKTFIEADNEDLPSSKERLWTIFVYMCADNNLESAAINDIYEMEASTLDTEQVEVIILLDRSPAYNNSNSNWSGTKMFRLKSGRGEADTAIISEEIACRELGLTLQNEAELDMADADTLSNGLSFCIKHFPASHYGLIMWGHGSGWKSSQTGDLSSAGEADSGEAESGEVEFSEADLYKGFAYDESSSDYLTLKQFASALKSGLDSLKLDFIAFDTCYGAELEVLYEIKDYALLALGSEGLISSKGWNYQLLFSDFNASPLKSLQDFSDLALLQFKKEYSITSRSSFAVCDLSKCSDYFTAFDSFMKASADEIKTVEIRDSVLECIYSGQNCNTEIYSYGKEGYDVYLDTWSLCENLNTFFNNSSLSILYEAFMKSKSSFIISSWASDRDEGGLGVYFQTLTTGGLLKTSFDSNYVKDKTYNQILFVSESDGYVPGSKNGDSFLDKLFNCEF